MAITVTSVSEQQGSAAGLSVTWENGQFVMLICPKGVISCGIVSKEIVEKFSFAFAIAHGTPQHPLVTADDLLNAKVSEVSEKAFDAGVRTGMTGREIIPLLS